MKRAGVVHTPGMADEMLAELAPLLAADGVDLENPDADLDLDRLNAALAAATERYNMELFTPVGDARALALSTLREISDAVQREDQAAAEQVLGEIGPYEDAGRPSAAQLIGTSLDLLDAWHSQDPTRGHLQTFSAPRRLGKGRGAGPDLLALARKGRAFATLDKLIGHHRGQAVADAGALLVAATLRALAAREGRDYATVASQYLGEAPPSSLRATTRPDTAAPTATRPAATGSSAPGSAFGAAAAAELSTRTHLQGYRRWLQGVPGAHAAVVEAEVSSLEDFFRTVALEGVDPQQPENIYDVLDLADEIFAPHQLPTLYGLLHDYVHYRMEEDPEDTGWAEAHAVISEELFEDEDGAPDEVQAALREAEGLDDGQRRAALAHLPLVSATRELLRWIGASRQITASGLLRRADIEPVAAMLGISAEGVAQQVPIDFGARAEELAGPVSERQRVYVQSAKEIPELAAWWVALQEAGVIELTSTRVRPGPSAAALDEGAELPLDVVDELVTIYVAEILIAPMDGPVAIQRFGHAVVMQTADQVLRAIAPDAEIVTGPGGGMAELLGLRVRGELRRLEAAGILEFPDDGAGGAADGRGPVVPVALRQPVMVGVMLAGEMLDPGDEDEDDDA